MAWQQNGIRQAHSSMTNDAIYVLGGLAVVVFFVARQPTERPIGFGVIRGRTIELFTRGGELWERASRTTIGVGWGGLLLARVVVIGVAAAIGAKVAASPTSIPLMLAVTLGAQMIVVRGRARGSGVPIARRAQWGSGVSLWRREEKR